MFQITIFIGIKISINSWLWETDSCEAVYSHASCIYKLILFEYLSLFNPRKLLNESHKLQCEETPDNS